MGCSNLCRMNLPCSPASAAGLVSWAGAGAGEALCRGSGDAAAVAGIRVAAKISAREFLEMARTSGRKFIATPEILGEDSVRRPLPQAKSRRHTSALVAVLPLHRIPMALPSAFHHFWYTPALGGSRLRPVRLRS